MSRPVYRRGEPYAQTVRELLRLSLHPETDATLDSYKLALVRAVRERITLRELKCMTSYYVQKLPMVEIAKLLGINTSTVSRNIHRGEGKLDSLMRLANQISPIRFDLSA